MPSASTTLVVASHCRVLIHERSCMDIIAHAGLRNHQGFALLSSPFISAVVNAIVQTLRLEKAGQLLR